MKKLLLLFFISLQVNLMSAQSVGDTIRVQAFNHNSITRDTLIHFPTNSSLTFEKIILKYNMRCKNGTVLMTNEDGVTGCGEWDYSVNTFIADSSKIEKVLTKQPNYVISGFTGTSFPYTTQQTYDHYDFTQKNVVLNSTISETAYQVGTGSTVMSNLVRTNLKSGRSQMLIKASELTAAGFTAGNINAINLNVANTGGLAKFLKIKMKNSSLTSMQTSAIDFTGFTDVYFRDYTFVNGANRIQFHTPFNWDGTSNIVIEMSFTNGTNGTNIDFLGFSNAENRVLTASNVASLNVSGGGYGNLNTQFFNTINNQLTVTFWTKGDSVMPVSNSIIYAYSNNNMSERQLNIHMPWNTSIYFDCGYVGSTFDRVVKAYGSNSVIKDVWNHWAFTKNTTTGVMNIYLNGVLWSTGTGKTKVMNFMNFVLGRLNDGINNSNYLGNIKELTVWDKELTLATIQSWKNKTIDNTHPDYANLVAYYKLNEETGQTINDSKHGLSSTGTNFNWNFERGDQLTTTFTESTVLPNITFYRGTYNQTTTDVVRRFSQPRNAKSVKNYTVTSNEGVVPMANDIANLVSTTYKFDTTPENVYNADGATPTLVTTLPITAEGTLTITDLDLYKRYPYYNELVSFVSPYGKGLDLGMSGKSWYFDMSDYVKLLKGNKRLVVNGGIWQEELDLEFLFIVGTPPRNVVQYDQLWQGSFRTGNISIANIIDGTKFPTNNYAFSPSASSFKLKSSITGHGNEGEFSQNGGQVYHRILVNNVQKFNWTVTQSCSENPIFPQGGTWVYDRQGWCPGMRTFMKEQDLTPHVTAGTTMALDYKTSNPSVTTGAYNYISVHQLVGYGAPNFTVDASIEQIKAPNNANAEFQRINPMCERPIITLKNTGANTLTSVAIEYWINNASTHQTYTWTGSLASMASTDILLPVNNLWNVGVTSSNNKFTAKITAANGGADGYVNNNKVVSKFSLPNVMPSVFKIEVKTNNYPTQNNFTLYDSNGTTVDSRSFSAANTTYTYTYQSPQVSNGCYHLRFNDTGKDGLQWWASTAQGAGTVKILDASNTVLKTFNPDFGGGFDYSFSVNTLLSNDDFIGKREISVYPNPSKGHFSVEGDDLTGSKIVVFDILGKIITEKTADNNLVEFNQNNLSTGVYTVKIEKEKQIVVKKLIVN